MPTSATVSGPRRILCGFSQRTGMNSLKKKGQQGQKPYCNQLVLMNAQHCDDTSGLCWAGLFVFGVLTAQKYRRGGGGSRWRNEKPFQRPRFGTIHEEAVLKTEAVALRLLWCLRSPERRGLDAVPPSFSQLCDMEGVAGRQMTSNLWLKAVDVAAVAEQVTVQWITAVALLVV